MLQTGAAASVLLPLVLGDDDEARDIESGSAGCCLSVGDADAGLTGSLFSDMTSCNETGMLLLAPVAVGIDGSSSLSCCVVVRDDDDGAASAGCWVVLLLTGSIWTTSPVGCVAGCCCESASSDSGRLPKSFESIASAILKIGLWPRNDGGFDAIVDDVDV